MGAYPSTKKSVLTKLPDYNVELLYCLVIIGGHHVFEVSEAHTYRVFCQGVDSYRIKTRKEAKNEGRSKPLILKYKLHLNFLPQITNLFEDIHHISII